MRRLIYACAVAAVVVVTALPVVSQTGSESLSETTQWIQVTLGGAACAAFAMGGSQAQLQQYTEGTEAMFSGCDMTLDTSLTAGSGGTLGSYKVPLAKLDPSRVSVIDGVNVPAGWLSFGDIPRKGIRLVIMNDEKLIDVKMEQMGSDTPNPSSYKAGAIDIHIRDQETAEKLVNAFSHAIALCGGKNNP